jgi:F-type H+-transporting ATPase subunit gamma
MANLKQIKTKIKSVSNLKKITRALEVVSTVKLQKAKGQAEALKEYLAALLKIITSVGLNLNMFETSDTKPASDEQQTKELAIIVTTERGLCGSINSKLLRKAISDQKWKTTDWFVIGKKWLEFLKRADQNIVGSLNISDNFKQEELLPLYTFFDVSLSQGNYSSVKIYFNYFKNSIIQIPTSIQVMPFDSIALQIFLDEIGMSFANLEIPAGDTMIIEPNHELLKIELKRQMRNYMINAAVIQNKAWEHASRMIAMKNAKDNATGFVKKLTLNYNKTRQGVITQEISEIVSAKIAIEG